jgi:hypothetical protein
MPIGAFIVYAPAYDDGGVLVRPVGPSGSWGVSAEQLEQLFRYGESQGIGRDAWPDCTRAKLPARQIAEKNRWLQTRLSMLDEERITSFTLDSGEPILAKIRDAIRDGNLIVITH